MNGAFRDASDNLPLLTGLGNAVPAAPAAAKGAVEALPETLAADIGQRLEKIACADRF